MRTKLCATILFLSPPFPYTLPCFSPRAAHTDLRCVPCPSRTASQRGVKFFCVEIFPTECVGAGQWGRVFASAPEVSESNGRGGYTMDADASLVIVISTSRLSVPTS
ncbi:hypothetical protein BJ138DRAFT_1146398 [Hygrophoropsis aurantiaca]|uniref:Uncharacterized protein n=1 Tax=Hygrophoropsis aurantiaca TaxID=72124 RepID=A0ACB8AIW6_9AGAM|nr:hypothetical protein BJ138DRAFT_1146398 [Hygrophoropsis aurantiaca]